MTDILYYTFEEQNYSTVNFNNNTSFELKNEVIQNISSININFLKDIINRYNFTRDKVTDIYSYYEFKSEEINSEIVILGDYHICNFSISFDKENKEEKLNMYDININVQDEMIINRLYKFGESRLQIIKNNNGYNINYLNYKNNEIIKSILINFKSEIMKLNQFIDIQMFTDFTLDYEENKFNFIGNNTHLVIYDDIIYHKDGSKETYDDGFIKIVYENSKNITKKIYVKGELVFESDIETFGFNHKINKLESKLDQLKNMNNAYIPYFLFNDKEEHYEYLKLVYGFSSILTNKYNLNLYRIPCIMTYEINSDSTLKRKSITELVIENETKIEKETVLYESENVIDNKIYDYISQNPYKYDLNNVGDLDEKINELSFMVSDILYKFIITYGGYSSKEKPVQNIAIVSENGTSSSDISKISLKQDGTVDITRTNNSNKLSVKSVTRDRFKGNIGYKFAVSDGIPCVISLRIPDEANVVFDHYHNKFRTDRCVPISIKPIANKNVVEIKNTCNICMSDEPNVMYNPCMHTSCSTCIALYNKENCHICNKKIQSFITLSVNNKNVDLNMATSAIYTSDFEYELNQEIFINDFDPTTYWKCSSGIHFHSNINDVYAWLEFIDIPEELKVKPEPIITTEPIMEINMDKINLNDNLNENLNENIVELVPRKRAKQNKIEEDEI